VRRRLKAASYRYLDIDIERGGRGSGRSNLRAQVGRPSSWAAA